MSDDQKTKLRADYAELFGKAPFNGWDETELQKRIDERLANPEQTEANTSEPTADPYPSQADLDKMRAGNFVSYKSR